MIFTGDFKNLKKNGYIYTTNNGYICWCKKAEKDIPFDIWIRKAGRNIEISDWGNCTEVIVEKLKCVNWNKIKPSWCGVKYVTIWWEQSKPKGKIEVTDGMNIKEKEFMRKKIFFFEGVENLLEELEILKRL